MDTGPLATDDHDRKEGHCHHAHSGGRIQSASRGEGDRKAKKHEEHVKKRLQDSGVNEHPRVCAEIEARIVQARNQLTSGRILLPLASLFELLDGQTAGHKELSACQPVRVACRKNDSAFTLGVRRHQRQVDVGVDFVEQIPAGPPRQRRQEGGIFGTDCSADRGPVAGQAKLWAFDTLFRGDEPSAIDRNV